MWGDRPLPFKEAAWERVARRIKAVYQLRQPARSASATARSLKNRAQPKQKARHSLDEKDSDAAAGRRASFSRQRTRLRRRGRWGSRFQYFDDGLSGNPHGPVLRRPDRDDDVSPDRQHRNQP